MNSSRMGFCIFVGFVNLTMGCERMEFFLSGYVFHVLIRSLVLLDFHRKWSRMGKSGVKVIRFSFGLFEGLL